MKCPSRREPGSGSPASSVSPCWCSCGCCVASRPRRHPRLRPRLPAVLTVLRAAKVRRAVLFGSGATSEGSPAPRDLDVLVHFGGPAKGRAARYFALRRALEQAAGLPVDVVEDEAVDNPYLRDEIARTGVVLLAAA